MITCFPCSRTFADCRKYCNCCLVSVIDFRNAHYFVSIKGDKDYAKYLVDKTEP